MNEAASSPTGADRPLLPTHSNRLLILAATAMELAPLQEALGRAPAPVSEHEGDEAHDGASRFDFLVCGVGPVACAATLAAHLAVSAQRSTHLAAISPAYGREHPAPLCLPQPAAPAERLHRGGPCDCIQPVAFPTGYAGVVLGGVGGLYPQVSLPVGHPSPLICLAEREILADFGIAAPHGADPFNSPDFTAEREFPLHSPLTAQAVALLNQLAIPFQAGLFLTVNAATATLERSRALSACHRGLCENMEGAAAALVCQRFGLPLLEIRAISNLVEDRDPERWRLAAAIKRQAEVLARLLPQLAGTPQAEDLP